MSDPIVYGPPGSKLAIQLPEPTDAQLKAFDAKVERMIGAGTKFCEQHQVLQSKCGCGHVIRCAICNNPITANVKFCGEPFCLECCESQAIESTNSAAEKEIESLKVENKLFREQFRATQNDYDELAVKFEKLELDNEALRSKLDASLDAIKYLDSKIADNDWITTPCTHDKMPKDGDRIVYEFEPAEGFSDWNVWKIEAERPFLIWDVVLRFKIIERAKQ